MFRRVKCEWNLLVMPEIIICGLNKILLVSIHPIICITHAKQRRSETSTAIKYVIKQSDYESETHSQENLLYKNICARFFIIIIDFFFYYLRTKGYEPKVR